MRERLRRRGADERGMTLAEVMITMAVLSLALVVFLSVLASVQAGIERQVDRSSSNDQARLAVEQLDRELRSGNFLYDPSLENDPANGIYPGMALRIYTQTNANTRNPGNRCVQWRVLDGTLQRRYWSVNWRTDGIVSEWLVVADRVVNATVSPPVPAFVLDPDPTKGGRTVIVTILTNENARSGQNVRIQESLTGRNTQYGYPSYICDDIPPY